MRRLTILVALALADTVAATEAAKPTSKPTAGKPTIAKTQPPKGGAAKPTTVHSSVAKASIAKASVKGPTVKGASAKGATAKGSSAKPPTVKTTGAQAKASGAKSVKPAKVDAKVAKADVKVTKVDTKSAKAERKTKRRPTRPVPRVRRPAARRRPVEHRWVDDSIDFTATKVGQKLEKNSALRSKIEAKLQAAGYTGSVYEAAYGFKNVGQFNAATNQVQNHGYSFELLKVLMTGTYVDPKTHTVYRANRLPDGTINLIARSSRTNPASTLSLGQSKQSIAAGGEMPDIVVARTNTTSGTNRASSTSAATSVKSKPKRKSAVSTVQPGGGSF